MYSSISLCLCPRKHKMWKPLIRSDIRMYALLYLHQQPHGCDVIYVLWHPLGNNLLNPGCSEVYVYRGHMWMWFKLTACPVKKPLKQFFLENPNKHWQVLCYKRMNELMGWWSFLGQSKGLCLKAVVLALAVIIFHSNPIKFSTERFMPHLAFRAFSWNWFNCWNPTELINFTSLSLSIKTKKRVELTI